MIAGPTASGKTSLAIEVANDYHTEIISADSRQLFKEMSIGTAKPTADELAQAKHHFVNHISIHDRYSAGQFEKEVLALLSDLFQENDVVVMVGGSGLYIQAVCEGFDDLPNVSNEIRESLKKRLETDGLGALVEELNRQDPVYADEVDQSNSHRVLRALEVIKQTGQPFSSFRKNQQAKRSFNIRKFAINWEREILYDRINKRVDLMIEQGLEAEAKSLHSLKQLNALQTVGYSEWFDYFDGIIDRAEAIRLIKRNSRRYAKRQMTWLRRDESVKWIKPGETSQIIKEARP